MPAKRCPMCRKINRDSAQRCECGYEFGQQDIHLVLENLKRQQGNGWAVFGMGLLLCLAGGAVTVGTILIGGFLRIGIALLVIGGVGTVKGGRMIATSRASTRELEERMKLPEARVLR
jgi:hypothetical protein